MPLAIGGTTASARPPHGALWVDVRDFGARADGGATDNTGPIQAAIDALAAKLDASVYQTGVVFVPSGSQAYALNGTLWLDHDRMTMCGEGGGSILSMNGWYGHTALLLGVYRKETAPDGSPRVASAAYRPDAFGKLDASAAPSAGVVAGLRTRGDAFAQFQACPLTCGVTSQAGSTFHDNWGETRRLTVEFMLDKPDGAALPPDTQLLGVGAFDPFEASPFLMKCWYAADRLMFVFKTSDQKDTQNNRYFSFQRTGGWPCRIAVVVDLVAQSAYAFVNGVQVATGDPANMSFGPGLTFASNEHYPFMLGATGLLGPYGGSTADLTFYGLRVSATARYQNRGVGQPQTRSDQPGTPLNDAWAYFGDDPNTVAWLAGDDPVSSRVIHVRNGGATHGGHSSGLLIHTTPPHPMGSLGVRDLKIVGAKGYGQGISIGGGIRVRVDNVDVSGGFQGVGSFNQTANYFLYLRDSLLDGADSGYFGCWNLLKAKDVEFASSGRVTIRSVASAGKWDGVTVQRSTPVTENVVKARAGSYGGAFEFNDILIDYEGDTLQGNGSIFHVEAHAQCVATSLRINSAYVGTVGQNCPVVRLRDTAPEHPGLHKGDCRIDNLQIGTSIHSGIVEVEGPLWHGEVNGKALTGKRFTHKQVYGTTTNVTVRETAFVAPPRDSGWYAGAHVLEVRSPADGQYAEWRCVGTGQYGTPTPPAWAGLNPVPASPSGLAAYVSDCGYMGVTLS